jgi:oligopeptide/dipeptide ABC transporter ATP-binding protein
MNKASNKQPILSIKNLRVIFSGEFGEAAAINDVSFDLFPKETLAVVGESGCGKTVTALSILRLIQSPQGKIEKGLIEFEGENILKFDTRSLYRLRGNKISMIFQEPMTSLNPVFTVGNQIIEAIQLHQGLDIQEAENKAIEMLQLVGIPSPEQRIQEYPHQLSGGMRQRVMIAMSLSCNPEILIADEPTTALDVTIQAQILELIKKLQKELGLSVIMITHDLGVIAEICDRVIVMYAGQIVEEGAVKEIFHSPQHPYTQGLLKSIPKIGEHIEDDSLFNIKGVVPPATNYPVGCHFEPRCDRTIEKCKTNKPSLENIYDTHQVRCFECIK